MRSNSVIILSWIVFLNSKCILKKRECNNKKKQQKLPELILRVLLHISISSTFGVMLQERLATAPCLLLKPRVYRNPSPLTIDSVPFATVTAFLTAFRSENTLISFGNNFHLG